MEVPRAAASKVERMATDNNAFDFTGKVALVTGGGAGIGRATSLRFALHGAKVVIGDINPAGVETVNLIKSEGGEAIFMQTDVREAKEVENLVTTAVDTYRGLHCAFNNAGILPSTIPLAEIDESTFDSVLAVVQRSSHAQLLPG
jgi:NAD(P)-dependent dehydrogenase (short-subunit alcohol dehydrogenase family)